MTNKLITVLLLLTACFILKAQKEDYNWVFGRNAGINFNDLNNPWTFQTKINSLETAASISDKDGNLLFYLSVTNDLNTVPWLDYGTLICDNNNSPITNGDSIKGYYHVTNGSIIIPAVQNEKRYYVFCLGPYDFLNCSLGFCLNLYYSEVEIMNGNLVVIQKNVSVVQELLEERIAAVKHANGKDWWILVHEYGYGWPVAPCSNKFYKVLLTANGPQYAGEQDIGTLHCHFYAQGGELIFSKDGTRMVMAIPGQGTVELFDFNRCTGNLSNYKAIDVSDVLMDPYGCEFSTQSNLLYVSGFAVDGQVSGVGGLYQYNINATSISSSKVALWENSNPLIGTGQLQIAPDNKIYMAIQAPDTSLLGDYISVINYPDSLGLASNFELYDLYLGDSARSTFSLPNMPNYNIGPTGIYTITAGSLDTVKYCQDQNSGVVLGSPQEDNVVYSWSPTFFLSDTNTAQPTASPTKDIWYYLTVRDTVSCNIERTDSVFVKVDSCFTGVYSHEYQESRQIKVYPNPTNETVYISLPKTIHSALITLTDISGKEILKTSQTEIGVSHLSQGLYFVRVEWENGDSVMRKIVVQ